MVDLYEDLTSSACGRAQLPERKMIPPAMESFKAMAHSRNVSGLQFAGLDEVYRYLRRSKKLVIPFEWRHLVPKDPKDVPNSNVVA